MSDEDEQWQQVKEHLAEASDRLRRAKGTEADEHDVLRWYFKEGEALGESQPALIDYLGISYPSVLDNAGYSDEDAQRVMDSLVRLDS